MPDDVLTRDERRKLISAVLAGLPVDRAKALRKRLEEPKPPLAPVEPGSVGFIVENTVFVGVVSGGPVVLKKAAYLAEGDVYRYGFFDPEDCHNVSQCPRGEPFWSSERSWNGHHDPELDRAQ